MKFQVKCVAALVAAGLAMGATQAVAGGKKTEDRDIIKRIDSDLKRIDKELFGWLKRDHKR
jgi:hypothetical protein